jgi:MYXO-CTERM domain-containing protein
MKTKAVAFCAAVVLATSSAGLAAAQGTSTTETTVETTPVETEEDEGFDDWGLLGVLGLAGLLGLRRKPEPVRHETHGTSTIRPT